MAVLLSMPPQQSRGMFHVLQSLASNYNISHNHKAHKSEPRVGERPLLLQNALFVSLLLRALLLERVVLKVSTWGNIALASPPFNQSPLRFWFCLSKHSPHLQPQEARKVVGLANLDTLGAQDRVPRYQVEVEVGKAVVDNRSLDGRLVRLA